MAPSVKPGVDMKKAVVAVLVIAAVIVAVFVGWIQFNKGAEYSLPWASTSPSSTPATKTASAAPAAPSSFQTMSATESLSVALDAPPTQYKAWREEMKTGCAAGSPALKVEHFDVNNDAIADTICWRTMKTKTWGEFVDLEAIVKNKSGQVQTAYIILGVSASEQEAICGDVDNLSVKQGKWTKKDFDQIGWDYVGPISIDIDGSECDPPWLFWPKDAKDDEVEFDFERV